MQEQRDVAVIEEVGSVTITPLDIATVALSKAVKDSAYKMARAVLTPGRYAVDFLASVRGTITVSPDTERVSTSRVLNQATIALLVRRMGLQRDSAIELLRSVFTEALTLDEDGRQKLLEDERVEETFDAVRRRLIKQLPKTPVAGQVRTDLDVEITF